MEVVYSFSDRQLEWLAELLKPEYESLWAGVLYGIHMSIRLKVTSQIAVFSVDILLAGMRSLDMDYLPIPSTFDEIIPPVYNQNRLYTG